VEIISRLILWAGYVACAEDVRNVYKVTVGQRERKRPFRLRHRWENNINMGLEVTWCEHVG
jgi:hypothetical protein